MTARQLVNCAKDVFSHLELMKGSTTAKRPISVTQRDIEFLLEYRNESQQKLDEAENLKKELQILKTILEQAGKDPDAIIEAKLEPGTSEGKALLQLVVSSIVFRKFMEDCMEKSKSGKINTMMDAVCTFAITSKLTKLKKELDKLARFSQWMKVQVDKPIKKRTTAAGGIRGDSMKDKKKTKPDFSKKEMPTAEPIPTGNTTQLLKLETVKTAVENGQALKETEELKEKVAALEKEKQKLLKSEEKMLAIKDCSSKFRSEIEELKEKVAVLEERLEKEKKNGVALLNQLSVKETEIERFKSLQHQQPSKALKNNSPESKHENQSNSNLVQYGKEGESSNISSSVDTLKQRRAGQGTELLSPPGSSLGGNRRVNSLNTACLSFTFNSTEKQIMLPEIGRQGSLSAPTYRNGSTNRSTCRIIRDIDSTQSVIKSRESPITGTVSRGASAIDFNPSGKKRTVIYVHTETQTEDEVEDLTPEKLLSIDEADVVVSSVIIPTSRKYLMSPDSEKCIAYLTSTKLETAQWKELYRELMTHATCSSLPSTIKEDIKNLEEASNEDHQQALHAIERWRRACGRFEVAILASCLEAIKRKDIANDIAKFIERQPNSSRK